MSQIVWGAPAWLWPSAFIAIVAAIAILYCYGRASQPGVRIIAATLKFAAVVTLVLCLLEPLFSGTRPRPKANQFAILVDNSCSMQIEKTGLPSAREISRWLSDAHPRWRDRLEQDFDLRLYEFDHQLRQVDESASIEFDGISSRIFSAVETISDRFRQRPIAGALLLTDGNGTDDLQQMPRVNFPIYPVVSETADEIRDLRIRDVRISQTNFESSPTTVLATLEAEGLMGKRIVVELRNEKGDLVEQQTVDLPETDDDTNSVRFRFRPTESGLSFYSISTYLKSDQQAFERGKSTVEATLANNTRTILVDRGGGPFRILYIAGRPNWDFKFLRRSLADDDEIQLVGLLRIASKEPRFAFRDRSGVGDTNRLFEGFEDGDDEEAEAYDQPVLVRLGVEDESELRDGFPTTADELFSYHAIIIDDLEAGFFSADQMLLIRRFVSERGGGLMMLGGQASFAQGRYDRTPLGELLPVYVNASDVNDLPGEYRLALTREGWLETWLRLRSTEVDESSRLDAMTTFRTRNAVGHVKPGAMVVATVTNPENDSAPAIVTQRFGKGRTAAMTIGDFWRWSMRRRADQPDDLAIFWRQAMRWLTADVPRRVEVEAAKSNDDSVVQIRCRVRDEEFKPYDGAQIRLKLSGPDATTFELMAEADDDQPGVYSASFWPHKEGGYLTSAEVTAADGSLIDRRKVGWTSQPAVHEFQRIRPNIELLRSIAENSGGELVDPNTIETFVASLPSRKVPITEPWVYPLWHQPWLFGFAILCLCAEWGLRRWKGLA